MAVVANLTTIFHAKVDKYKSDILGVRMTWEQIGSAAKELGITGKGAAQTFNRMLQQVEQAVLGATPPLEVLREELKMLDAMFQKGKFAPELYAKAVAAVQAQIDKLRTSGPGNTAVRNMELEAMSRQALAAEKLRERIRAMQASITQARAEGGPGLSAAAYAAQLEKFYKMYETDSGLKRPETRAADVNRRWDDYALEVRTRTVTKQQLLNRELARQAVLLRRGLLTQQEYAASVAHTRREALGAANIFEGWWMSLKRASGIIKTVMVGLTAAKVFGGISEAIGEAFQLEEEVRRASVAFDGAGVNEIRAMSLALGRDTGFAGSALDAAKAIEELGKSGRSLPTALMSARDILMFQQGGDFPDIESAVRAASMVQSAMQLRFVDDPEKDAAALRYVTDVLTKAGQVTITSTEEMAKAFQNVGSTASLMGYSLIDTASALIVLTDQGKKGLEAGTELAIAIREIGSAQLELPSASEIEERSTVLRKYMQTGKEILDDMKKQPTSLLEERLGVTFYDKQTGAARKYRDVVIDLNKKLSTMSTIEQQAALKDVIPERATKFALAFFDLFGDSGGDKIGVVAKQMENFAGSTERAASQSLTSMQKVLKQTKGDFSALASIGVRALDALSGSILTMGTRFVSITGALTSFIVVFKNWVLLVEVYNFALKGMNTLLKGAVTWEAILTAIRSGGKGSVLKALGALAAAGITFVGIELAIKAAVADLDKVLSKQMEGFTEAERKSKIMGESVEELQRRMQEYRNNAVSPLEDLAVKVGQLEAMALAVPHAMNPELIFRNLDKWVGEYQQSLANLPSTVANAAAAMSGSREAFSLRHRVEVKGGKDERMLQQLRAANLNITQIAQIIRDWVARERGRPVEMKNLNRKDQNW